MPYPSSRMVHRIKTDTKIGRLTVGNDCNEEIDWGFSGWGGRRELHLAFHLNHRSEDIEAKAELRMTPKQARQLAGSLMKAADELDDARELD